MDFLLISFIIPLVAALAMLARRVDGNMAGLGLHPYNALGLLLVIIAIDFVVVSIDVRTTFVNAVLGYTVNSQRQVAAGALFFLLCSIGIVGGVATATLFGKSAATPLAARAAAGHDQRAVMAVGILVVGILVYQTSIIFANAISSGSLLYVAATRANYFRDNILAYTLISMAVPAFYLLGSRFGLTWRTTIVGLVIMLCLLLFGSRGLIIFTVVGMAFWLARRKNVRLSTIYMAMPVLFMFSAVYRYFARETRNYGSLAEFLRSNDGLFGTTFRTEDISFAELIIVGVNNVTFYRQWSDPLLAALVAPIPRSIIPWKPFGASVEFTRFNDLEYFDLTGSAKTVTGLVDIFTSSSFFVAPLVIGALAFVWAWFWVRAQHDSRSAAFTGPVLIACAYLFLRGDTHIVAMFVWPVTFVVMMNFFLATPLISRR